MNLPLRSRARLAARLLDSLGSATRQQLDQRWAAEVESRIEAFDVGRLKAVPASAILAYAGKSS